MRMAGPDANPKNVRTPFARKSAQPGNGKEECFPCDGFQILFERLLDIVRNVAEETERQVHLLRCEPADAAQMRVQFRELFSNGGRKLETDEEPFRAHFWRANSRPECDVSPSGPVGGGSSTVLITFSMLPAMFGKSALPMIVARASRGIVKEGEPRRQAAMI